MKLRFFHVTVNCKVRSVVELQGMQKKIVFEAQNAFCAELYENIVIELIFARFERCSFLGMFCIGAVPNICAIGEIIKIINYVCLFYKAILELISQNSFVFYLFSGIAHYCKER